MARVSVCLGKGKVTMVFNQLRLENVVHGYPFESQLVLKNDEAGIVVELSHEEAKRVHEELGKLIEWHEKMIKEEDGD